MLSFTSEIRTPVFVKTGSNDNGTYTLRSSPEIYTFKTTGGKLNAVRITSPKTINIASNPLGVENSPFVNRWNSTFKREDGSQVGSKRKEQQKQLAKYRLTGRRTNNAFVYALIVEEGEQKGKLEIIADPAIDPDNPNADTVIRDPKEIGMFNNPSEIISGNHFSKLLNLPIRSEEKTTYTITVYQTVDQNIYDAIRKLKADTQGDLKGNQAATIAIEAFNQLTSAPAVHKLVIDTRNVFNRAPLPNWITFSTEAFFPIVEPIDQALSEMVDAIRASIPSGPYDQISDWLDLLSDKIQDLIDLANRIAEIIDNLDRFLSIGGDGLWALGISGANGVQGMVERFQTQEVPTELRDAKFVTGIVMLVPNELLGIPTGSVLMDTVFSALPSEGTDNAKEEQNRQSFEDKLKELGKETTEKVLTDIEQVKGAINKLDNESLISLGKSMEDIE
jgi:hypothetical protein